MSFTKSPRPHTKIPLFESEAKNPLPTREYRTSSWAEGVGLFWMFLDDPWRIRDYSEYLKRKMNELMNTKYLKNSIEKNVLLPTYHFVTSFNFLLCLVAVVVLLGLLFVYPVFGTS